MRPSFLQFILWPSGGSIASVPYVMLCREKCSQLNPLLWTHTLLILSTVNVFARTAAWGLWSEFWQIGGTVGLWGKTAGWHRACLIQSPHSISVTDNCLYRGAASLPRPQSSITPQLPHTNTCVCVISLALPASSPVYNKPSSWIIKISLLQPWAACHCLSWGVRFTAAVMQVIKEPGHSNGACLGSG